ncbi:MAG: DinB family protein [Anaerolineae bacterium]|nr:DinB family protein [Anaerolineae bacterium]
MLRFKAMNCIAWNVGHLAWQEQRYFLLNAQDILTHPDINEQFAYGAPASTPNLSAMQAAWESITAEADAWLDALTTERLQQPVVRRGKPTHYLWGSLLLRTIYHYWYHNGENQAIRQMLGHSGLRDFVGDLDGEAPYLAE